MYTVQRDYLVPRFPWLVIGPDGGSALWRPDAKLGVLPMRFRTDGIANVFAARLNAALL
jgi:hypothetical protein